MSGACPFGHATDCLGVRKRHTGWVPARRPCFALLPGVIVTTAAPRSKRSTSRSANGSTNAVVEVPAEHLAEVSAALAAFRNGDFTVRLGRRDGLLGDVVDRFNEVADLQ